MSIVKTALGVFVGLSLFVTVVLALEAYDEDRQQAATAAFLSELECGAMTALFRHELRTLRQTEKDADYQAPEIVLIVPLSDAVQTEIAGMAKQTAARWDTLPRRVNSMWSNAMLEYHRMMAPRCVW